MGSIPDDQLCAHTTNKGICSGDSGGPLTVIKNGKHYLAGVTSWSYSCNYVSSYLTVINSRLIFAKLSSSWAVQCQSNLELSLVLYHFRTI